MSPMSRELLILRHAKSAWNTAAPSDFDRPLAPRGEKAAPRVGRWMKSQGLAPDYVVSSPAERARQTVLAACSEVDFDPARIHWDERVYGAWTRTLVYVLRETPDEAERVLIAGHNPGLEDLVRTLASEPVSTPSNGKLMPTATLAHFAIDVPWAELGPETGRLLSITRAKSLKD